MSFKFIEEGPVFQTGGIEDILYIPVGLGRSFNTNYKLNMLLECAALGLKVDTSNEFSIRDHMPIVRNQYQNNLKPTDEVIDLKLGNRTFHGLEEPVILTKFNANIIEPIPDNVIVISYKTHGGKPNGKNNPRRNIGNNNSWYPKRNALYSAILECAQ